MKQRNRDKIILEHIIAYAEKIERSIQRFGNDFQTFLDDADFRDAVSMNILQIGELAKKLSDEYVKETSNQMNWKAIKGMRDFFAHDYGSMDIERIWETAIEDIPQLKAFCQSQIAE